MDPVTALAAGVIAFLTPHLAELAKKTTEKAVEKLSEALPEQAGKLWSAITTKFKGQPVAEAVAKQAAEKPEDTGAQEMFRLQLKQMLEADQAFKAEIQKLLEAAKAAAPAGAHASGQGVVATTGGVAVSGNVEGGIRTQPTTTGQTGAPATATDESAAASSGGVAVRGTVKGGITVGGATPEPTKAEPPAEKKS